MLYFNKSLLNYNKKQRIITSYMLNTSVDSHNNGGGDA